MALYFLRSHWLQDSSILTWIKIHVTRVNSEWERRSAAACDVVRLLYATQRYFGIQVLSNSDELCQYVKVPQKLRSTGLKRLSCETFKNSSNHAKIVGAWLIIVCHEKRSNDWQRNCRNVRFWTLNEMLQISSVIS